MKFVPLYHTIALVTCIYTCWTRTFVQSWIWLSAISFGLRLFFITGFYHCYFSHRQYETSRCWQFLFGVLGCTALQKGPLSWSSCHRRHCIMFSCLADASSHSKQSDAKANRKDTTLPWCLYSELVWLDKLHFVPYALVFLSLSAVVGLLGTCWIFILPQILLWYLIGENAHYDSRNEGGLQLCNLNKRHHARLACLIWALTHHILWILEILGILHFVSGSGQCEQAEQRLMHVPESQLTTFDPLIKDRSNAIYEGTVVHTRYWPIINQFSYKIYLMYIELDDKTDAAFDPYWFWSSRGDRRWASLALASFRASEYLSKEKIQNMVRDEWQNDRTWSDTDQTSTTRTSVPHIQRVFLLTHFRYFGVKFNPVSYYYCFDQHDQLVALISEVHNTPWSEMCWYVHRTPHLSADAAENKQRIYCPVYVPTTSLPKPDYYWTGKRPRYTDCKRKKMHVSPFFQMNYTYRVKYDDPCDYLNMSWEMFANHQAIEGRREFYVNMRLKRLDISQSTLNRVMCQYPLMTVKVILGIYFQAAKLYLRRVPFITHPAKQRSTEDQKSSPSLSRAEDIDCSRSPATYRCC